MIGLSSNNTQKTQINSPQNGASVEHGICNFACELDEYTASQVFEKFALLTPMAKVKFLNMLDDIYGKVS